ncbi:helix-turn-helix transcriptional regulator [Nocardiopsis aegyptia]|uniref:Transcriptional regulator with XRE-family HTH domain n=1 Tax=Nocardiopsis aegyptia TaxID=220378 RepID=A0A7Z0ENX4_9ACTN|nr:helix-turn-helix transcriptional regulator [Nocardiopsis aegyptia]NYJ35588.1 transcriptional regulator with XRE-family HTH domain [Nocardiopsis aegyptia]
MNITQESTQGRNRQRTELKDFLRTRRARLTPGDVGLPPGGRRRTPGLRREEVAVLAGVGTSWYIQLEQGRDITVSPSVLDAVSRALRLTVVERDHLYRLAGVNPPLVSGPEPDEAELARIVDHWAPSPAHVIDQHWNVIAMNHASETVFGYSRTEGETLNCLVAFFTDPVYRGRHRHWADMAPDLVAEFRRDAARHPDDPGFGRLADRLRRASPEFAELWARHDVVSRPQRLKAVDHPWLGPLRFEHSVLHMPDRPGVRLILNTAGADAATAEALERISAGASGRLPVGAP